MNERPRGGWRPPALARRLAALALTAMAGAAAAPLARAGDNRHDCLAWAGSHGAERVALANRIGAGNLLTKARPFTEASPGDPQSLYRSSDIRRFCAAY